MQPLRQQIDDDNFPMGLMASCRMRMSPQCVHSVSARYTVPKHSIAICSNCTHMDNINDRHHHHPQQAGKGGEPDGQQTVRKFGTVLSTCLLAT